eukprot:TRINITY_DN1202_c2_g2_i1.p1 TRINITY_DN1202_c2_g2~~TRINITY_DN1202_c2_g2_i1.p1  ORF type:complete len:565 (+),score=96.75 TRINITY_DN1202_c2_g2_i1:199-1695(+)
MVVAPRYDQYRDSWDTGFWSSVTLGGKHEPVHFYHTLKGGVDYVFVDHPIFLERVRGLTGERLYGPGLGKDFSDNQARFAYFCKAALLAIANLPLGGNVYGDNCIVVCNDWYSALVPMFIHAERTSNSSKWASTRTAFLCHNAALQGRFERKEGLAQVWDVPEHYVDSITFKQCLQVGGLIDKVDCVNTMAAGLRYADRSLTVSPSYARECSADTKKAVELEQFFARCKVTGILNGVQEGFSPSDKHFVTKTKMTCGTFTAATAEAAKAQLKATYRAENKLPAIDGPLMCFIGRLDSQRGYDLLLKSLTDVLETDDIQVVVVGSGPAGTDDLVAHTKTLAQVFPGKFHYAGWMGPERYSLLAACDYTILPSRWEPCGLVQMEAMCVGTCPIVAPTGGLKDTVEDGVNGIWTDAQMTMETKICAKSVSSISTALKRATQLFKEKPTKMAEMRKAAMATAAEFTWSNAAMQYEAVFEELGAKDTTPLGGKRVNFSLETEA